MMPQSPDSVQSRFGDPRNGSGPNPKKGKVFLVGAGPGDPGLITLRGAECLSQADVVLYDGLANSKLLRLARTLSIYPWANMGLAQCGRKMPSMLG